MKKKRLLSILLALAMILTFMPAMAFAESEAKSGPLPEAVNGVIDLSGDTYTLSGSQSWSNGSEDVPENVTIQNGTIISELYDFIKVTRGTVTLGEKLTITAHNGAAIDAEGGKLIIDGATIQSGTKTGAVYTLVYANGKNTEIVMEAGKIDAKDEGPICAAGGSTITINGGEVIGESNFVAAYSKSGGKIVLNDGSMTSKNGGGLVATGNSFVEINGGTITVPSNQYAFLAHEGKASAVMNGGTVNGAVGAGSSNTGDDNKLTITGGTVNGKVYQQKGKTEVSGGTFTADVATYITDDAAPVVTIERDTTTLYAVGEESVYETIEDGDIVTVTKGVSNDEGDEPAYFNTDKNVTVKNDTKDDLFVNGALITEDGEINSDTADDVSDKLMKAAEAGEAYEAARQSGDADKALEAAKAYKAAADAAKAAVDKQSAITEDQKNWANYMAQEAASELTAAQNAANNVAKKSADAAKSASDSAAAAVTAAATAAAQEAALEGVLDTKLPKASIKKPVKAKKAVTVKWKKLSKKKAKKVDGIEIWIASDKNFTDGRIIKVAGKTKVSKKVKKLQSKTTYYVKVRTYKNKSGVKHVSKWSNVKKVKTK
ncbi:MAG: hypothetical protein IJJ22_06975 [Oscillospiraceae bacterium]|nr:hypothetical protein [Oscillospiraceae bacterium]